MKLTVIFLALLAAVTSAFSQDPPKELQALNHYVGTWSTAVTGDPNQKGMLSAQWTLDGRFLQRTWTLEEDPRGHPQASLITMMTYDSVNKIYRSWSFISNGSTTTGEGTWDADAHAFTWTIKNHSNGNTTVTTISFAQDGIANWNNATKNADGKTVRTASGNDTRQNSK